MKIDPELLVKMALYGLEPGYAECSNCNGYGSSLHEDCQRCSVCGGSGVVAAVDLSRETRYNDSAHRIDGNHVQVASDAATRTKSGKESILQPHSEPQNAIETNRANEHDAEEYAESFDG